jgi:hypothetical protein
MLSIGLRCAISVLLMFWLELEMAFPLYVNVKLRKNTLLAGYAAVQHIAWDVKDVMQMPVGLRGQFAWPIRATLKLY